MTRRLPSRVCDSSLVFRAFGIFVAKAIDSGMIFGNLSVRLIGHHSVIAVGSAAVAYGVERHFGKIGFGRGGLCRISGAGWRKLAWDCRALKAALTNKGSDVLGVMSSGIISRRVG